MNETLRYILISYIAMISLISAVVCIADKHNSKIKGQRRVPEKTLLLLSALGGSAAMLTVMLLYQAQNEKTEIHDRNSGNNNPAICGAHACFTRIRVNI